MEATSNQSGSPACGSTPQIRTQSAGSAVPSAPLRFAWRTEVSAPKPFRARAFHGETFTLACMPLQYAKPLAGLSGATVALRWQTDGMGEDEWYAKAGAYDPATGELTADWGPDCDTGPDRVRFFLALETPGGAAFRAYGAIDLAPSPGFTPAQILPESELTQLQDALEDEAKARQAADATLKEAVDGKADAGHNHDTAYLKLSGGTLTGPLTTKGVTFKGDVRGDSWSLFMGYIESASAPRGAKSVIRRADIKTWVLPGDGLAAAISTDEKVTLAIKPATSTTIGGVKVDVALSEMSENPVQNRAVKTALDTKANANALAAEQTARQQGDADTLADAKAYADTKVAGVYHYKGSVATRAALPASPAVGDVWNVQDEDGQNVAWTGTAWDALGATVDLSAYDTAAAAAAKVAQAVAPKADANTVYAKTETYTKAEVQNLVDQAVAAAKAELLAQVAAAYAPLSSVQHTADGVTYRWAWDDTFQTFAMKPVTE